MKISNISNPVLRLVVLVVAAPIIFLAAIVLSILAVLWQAILAGYRASVTGPESIVALICIIANDIRLLAREAAGEILDAWTGEYPVVEIRSRDLRTEKAEDRGA